MKLNSCIYEGTIRHRRHVGVSREFEYRVFMMYVDLTEIPTVFNRHWLWSSNRPNVASFKRADYLGEPSKPLVDSVRELIQDRMGVTPEGPIRLLTNLRYFGFALNPISLYYCFNSEEQVEFVVAEVTNTPWRERHAYVLDARGFHGSKIKSTAPKLLHVSPFLGMEYEYRFHVSPPEANLSVHIENHPTPPSDDRSLSPGVSAIERDANSRAAFDATLIMKRRQLNSWNLAHVLCRYPLMTAQVFAKIHWQALRLWMKGVMFQSHPEHLPHRRSTTLPESSNGDHCGSGADAVFPPSEPKMRQHDSSDSAFETVKSR